MTPDHPPRLLRLDDLKLLVEAEAYVVDPVLVAGALLRLAGVEDDPDEPVSPADARSREVPASRSWPAA